MTRLHLLGIARWARKSARSSRVRVNQRLYPEGRYVTCNGATVFVDFQDPAHEWYHGNNLFLQQEHDAFVRLLHVRRPHTVLDIGAHWGIFPATLASGSDVEIDRIVEVLCVEPDPKNQVPLNKTVDLISRFNVKIAPVAVSASNGVVNAYRNQGHCLQTYAHEKSGHPTLQVVALDLHSLMARYGVRPEDVTHIKLDIDGYEPFLLHGCEDFFREVRPLMLIEFWAKGMQAAGVDVEPYFDLLLDLGDVYKVDYPSGRHIPLHRSDLPTLVRETECGVRNLLVIPR